MHKVGVIGLGMMGTTHLDVYASRSDVKVVAVADADPDRRSGRSRAIGNIEGQSQNMFDMATVRGYADGMELIADPDVSIVDICLATPLHRRFAEAALAAGKHVLVEKPLARTSEDADAIADAAEVAFQKSGAIAMPAMCMRFWPGWTWLKDAVASGHFGAVCSAQFRRMSSHPLGGFYSNPAASGGAILDLHIHDTDFIQYCFGAPRAVHSVGSINAAGGISTVATNYLYGDPTTGRGPAITAEGGWVNGTAFPFVMKYTVNFEKATVDFDISAAEPLRVYTDAGTSTTVEMPAGMGYAPEIAYFLDCVSARRRPEKVTLRQAADAIRIIEAEARSVVSGKLEPVSLKSAL